MAKGHTLGATLLLWCSVRYTLSSSGGGGQVHHSLPWPRPSPLRATKQGTLPDP